MKIKQKKKQNIFNEKYMQHAVQLWARGLQCTKVREGNEIWKLDRTFLILPQH